MNAQSGTPRMWKLFLLGMFGYFYCMIFFFHPIEQTSIKPPWDYHLSAINPAFSFFLFFGVTSQQSFVITSIPEMVQFLSKVSKIRLNSGSLIFTSIWYLFSHSPILLKLLLFTLHTFLLKRKEDTVRWYRCTYVIDTF